MLNFGYDPPSFRVRISTRDSSWTVSRVLTDATGAPVAWPAAPVLSFDDAALDVTADLSPDDETSTADALATWTMTSEQMASIVTRTEVRLVVDGIAWYIGGTRCRS